MKAPKWPIHIHPNRQTLVFTLVGFLVIACTSWLVVNHQQGQFRQRVHQSQTELVQFQLFSQSQLQALPKTLNVIEFMNAAYRAIGTHYPIQDVQLVSDDGTYFSINAGNPAQDLIVTEDDSDYASTPKSWAESPLWNTFFISKKQTQPLLWPAQRENALLVSIPLQLGEPDKPWLVILQIARSDLFSLIPQPLNLHWQQEIPMRSMQYYYQAELDGRWHLSAAWQIPWLYLASLLIMLLPIYIALVKRESPAPAQLSNSDFRQFIYNELNVLVFETDMNSQVLWVNGQLSNTATLFNVRAGDAVKKVLKPYPRYLTYWQHALNGERLTFELQEYEQCLRIHLWPVSNDENRVSGIGVMIHDISELKNLEKQMQHQQFHDDITGLPNRLFFIEQLQYILFKAKRKQDFVAVLALEISGLEQVNKLHGHDTTDLLLKQVIAEMQQILRNEDILCRFSDDEFLIGCDEYVRPEQLSLIAERLIQCTTAPHHINGAELKLFSNIGIATYPRDARDAGSLISNAITAMRHARQTGRNTLDYFSADNARIAHDQWQLEQDINKAMNAHDFTLHYQPIFLLESNRCVGAEALIRWPSSHLTPDQFIPMAEQTGLIHNIGIWVLETALKQFHDWRKAGSEIEYVSINLSALQFTDAEFLPKLDRLLATYPIRPGQMTLEITESVMMQTSQAMVRKLEALKERGFNIAIDDFGTGFSSLNYLKHLPVDYLKMDRAFVTGLPNSSNDQVICEAIIQLAVAMGLHIIAEGVETPAQMQWLQNHGVKSAQGYFFAHAVPAEEFSAYLPRPSDKNGENEY